MSGRSTQGDAPLYALTRVVRRAVVECGRRRGTEISLPSRGCHRSRSVLHDGSCLDRTFRGLDAGGPAAFREESAHGCVHSQLYEGFFDDGVLELPEEFGAVAHLRAVHPVATLAWIEKSV